MFLILFSTDVNECRFNRMCKCADGSNNCGAHCRDTLGSFSCSCKRGYRVFRKTVCVGKCVMQLKLEGAKTIEMQNCSIGTY